MRNIYQWTTEQTNLLVKLVNSGKYLKEISNELSLNKTIVYAKIKSLKINYKRERHYWDQTEIKKLTQMRESGLLYSEISKILNLSKEDIFRKCKELKIKNNTNIWTEEKTQRVLSLIKDNVSIANIGTIMKKNKKFIRKILEENDSLPEFSEKLKTQSLLKESNLKKCFDCLGIFPNTEEYFYDGRKCKHCTKQKSQIQRIKNKNKYGLDFILTRKFKETKARCLKNNIEFDLTLDFLLEKYSKQNGKCFFSGMTLFLSTCSVYSLSIDRLNSKKGYTKDNINLICAVVNFMKTDIDHIEFIDFCKKIAFHNNK